MSRKMTGAPSTKPPAVIGREWESLIGAWMPPVDMPEGRGSGTFCGLSGAVCEDCWLRANWARTKKPKRADAQRNSGTEWRDRGARFILERLRLPGASWAKVRRLGGFDRRVRFSRSAGGAGAAGF